MKNNNSIPDTGFSGLGIAEVLQIVFLVLKLTKSIDWSWVWVLAPSWISMAVAIVMITIFMIVTRKKKF